MGWQRGSGEKGRIVPAWCWRLPGSRRSGATPGCPSARAQLGLRDGANPQALSFCSHQRLTPGSLLRKATTSPPSPQNPTFLLCLPKFTSHGASSASLNPQWGRDSSMWGVLRGQPSPPWFHCPMTPSGQFLVSVGMPTPSPNPSFLQQDLSHSSSGQGSLLRPPRAVHGCGEEERGDEGSRSWGQPQGLTRHHGQVAGRHK